MAVQFTIGGVWHIEGLDGQMHEAASYRSSCPRFTCPDCDREFVAEHNAPVYIRHAKVRLAEHRRSHIVVDIRPGDKVQRKTGGAIGTVQCIRRRIPGRLTNDLMPPRVDVLWTVSRYRTKNGTVAFTSLRKVVE